MPFIDSHAHLTSPQFVTDERLEVFERATQAGIARLLNISTNRQELDEAFALGRHIASGQLLHAASTTPHEAAQEDPFFAYVEEQAVAGSLVAIGETGLDYYYEHAPKEVQKSCLHRYLDLSCRTNLPVVIHCREAFADFISILDEYKGKVRGVLHCFTGTVEDARKLLDRGFFLSFSGIVTYPKSRDLQEILQLIPLHHLLLETDAPYLAPQGFRGKRCEPAMITSTYTFVAQQLAIPLSLLKENVSANFERFIGK